MGPVGSWPQEARTPPPFATLCFTPRSNLCDDGSARSLAKAGTTAGHREFTWAHPVRH